VCRGPREGPIAHLPDNDAVLRGNNLIKLVPEHSVTELEVGDRIRLSKA
jgi:hypothetical protein